MIERDITIKLRKELKKHLVGAVVIKHADHFTSGVPDLSISFNGRTWWVEVKMLRAPIQYTSAQFPALQTDGMCRLEDASRALYWLGLDNQHAELARPKGVRDLVAKQWTDSRVTADYGTFISAFDDLLQVIRRGE